MCRSMVDIQSVAAEIRRGKQEEDRKKLEMWVCQVTSSRLKGEAWSKERWPARLVRPSLSEINKTECQYKLVLFTTNGHCKSNIHVIGLQLIKPIKTVVACCVEPRLVSSSDAVDRLTAAAPRSTRRLGDVIGEKGRGAPRTYCQCVR